MDIAVKTGMWKGVVTAFITMSNVRDEIDWEWPGAVTTEAQTNYFWLVFFYISAIHLMFGSLGWVSSLIVRPFAIRHI